MLCGEGFRGASCEAFNIRGVDVEDLIVEDFKPPAELEDVDIADFSAGLVAEACLAGVLVVFEPTAGQEKFP
jgi:hypothetical protein